MTLIRVDDQYYILARSVLADDRRRVLKAGDTFGVFDRSGDILPMRRGEQGLYHGGTRHLSRLSLRVDGRDLLLLGSTLRHRKGLLAVDLTNPDHDSGAPPTKGTVHIFRGRLLREGLLHERLRFTNFGESPIDVRCALSFGSEFLDIFEVRGLERARRGELLPARLLDDATVLEYRGLDGVTRMTRLRLSGPIEDRSADGFDFRLRLDPGEEETRHLVITCEMPGHPPMPESFEQAYERIGSQVLEREEIFSRVRSASELFDRWWERSVDDLRMLLTDLPEGPYPYAGIPWFSAPFGRDGLITGLECLWLAPDVARGVLAYLAATRATEEIPERDAEPGKILHEARSGEMAALGEVPFGRYYGSVDATPLFLVLAAAYHERTGDRRFLREILPAIEDGLSWIGEWGDPDGDGLVEYRRRSATGLVNQGWKDSHDAIFHADGSAAEGPIALVEVQGYVYDAKRRLAPVFRELGREETAGRLEREAEELRRRFEERFWMEERGCYALALDGRKRPLRVRASNAGHALFSGIASEERARRTAETLVSDDFFSGWGIRTLAVGEARYNPMSYHNGSVWPHDNALIAAGFARYGLVEHALRVMGGLLDASEDLDMHRMPELFCGFHRRPEEGPTRYPVACAPQAWSAGAACSLVQSVLGLSVDGVRKRITLRHPRLPSSTRELEIRRLRVGGAEVDLRVTGGADGAEVEVLRGDGEVEVAVP